MIRLTRSSLLLFVAGLALTSALVWAVATHIQQVSQGQEIILDAQGYDPRDLLSGHYAQTRYAINVLERPRAGQPNDDPAFFDAVVGSARWVDVWAIIEPHDGDWRVLTITRKKPTALKKTQLAVKAQARKRSRIDLLYGIERIYAQQSEAEALEDQLREPDVSVRLVAALGSDGRLRTKALLIGDERHDFGWW